MLNVVVSHSTFTIQHSTFPFLNHGRRDTTPRSPPHHAGDENPCPLHPVADGGAGPYLRLGHRSHQLHRPPREKPLPLNNPLALSPHPVIVFGHNLGGPHFRGRRHRAHHPPVRWGLHLPNVLRL